MAQKVEEGDEESFKHFELLKISILARIDDYDEFYKRNFLDNRISFFEKQKFRLRKLIFESEHGKTKVVKGTPPPPPQQPEPSVYSKNPANEAKHDNNVVYQVKMNKNDYNKLIAQKAKKGKA